MLKIFGKRRFSISFVLAASIGTLMAVMLLVTQALQFTVGETNTMELLRDKALEEVEEMEKAVHAHLDPAGKMITLVAGQMVEDGRLISRERLRDLFAGALVSSPSVGSINYFDENYRVFGLVPGPGGLPKTSPLTLAPTGVRNMTTTQRLMRDNEKAEGLRWNEPEFFGNMSFVVASHPIRINGEYKGFLASVVEVRSLSELMVSMSNELDSTHFILVGKDRVLAHPSLVRPHPDQSPVTPLPNLSRLDDPVLQRIWSSVSINRELDILDEDGMRLTSVRVDGEDYLFLTRTLIALGGEEVTVGAWFHAKKENGPIERLYMATFAGGLLLILGVILAILLGRHIARPVRRSAEAAARVSSFDLDEVEALPFSRIKELNDQARSFNAMLAGLRAFGQYVPRRLVNRLVHEEDSLETLSQHRELTIMFTDVVGFTSLSESLHAAEVADFLNHHFGLLGEQVEAKSGTIDKFIGDALMAFWGAPETLHDAPERACRAALNIRQALMADNAERRERGEATVCIRIGIHTGPVVVGNVGSKGRVNYTIVGDAVNTTQRLESLGREYQGNEDVIILISEDTRQQLDETFLTESLGTVTVKGRTHPLEVHKLIGRTS